MAESVSDFQPGAAPAPGRSCGGCTLCCKIFEIPEIAKPRHVWCGHCDTGKGCKIHETRPATCRDFFCGYLLMGTLPEHWKPSQARFVLTWESDNNRMVVNVDPGRPDAWRKEPYYAQLKHWARVALRNKGQVLVWQGKDAVVVLPDRDVFLGPVRPGQAIVMRGRPGPDGGGIDVEVSDGSPAQR